MTAPETIQDALDLLDCRRRIASLYAEVRSTGGEEAGWQRWRAVRDELFRSHPQSPVPAEVRKGFAGPAYFDHDPSARVTAVVEPADREHVLIGGSAGEDFGATRFGTARFELDGADLSLAVFWLDGYAGGVFCSFRDATSGDETYGACRYILDTVKGADLGEDGGRLVLDFNFAYNPSCSYDPRWACPLAPPENVLPVPVRAGERLG